MSEEARAWAIPLRGIGAIPKAVLFALSDMADTETLTCSPSVSRLVDYVDADARTVIAALNWLADLGLIEQAPLDEVRPALGHKYRIMMGCPLDKRLRITEGRAA